MPVVPCRDRVSPLPFLIAALLICSAPAGAQTINVTGYLDVAGQGPLVLVGNRGFAFASGMSFDNFFPGVIGCNSDPAHCVPGQTLDLRAVANDEVGTATIDGTTYRSVGGQSPNAVVVDFEGSVVLPPIAPTATVSTTFTFTGRFVHAVAGSSSQAQETLTGSGDATVYLHSPGTPGFPNSWFVDRVVYHFNSALPGLLTAADIGAVGMQGASWFSDGQFHVAGSGADIWGTADAFQFLSHALTNSADELIVRVDAEQNTNAYAKAGVMIRASFAPASPHALLDIKPDGGIEFLARTTWDGTTAFIAGGRATFPVWLKLAINRNAASGFRDLITGSMSADGLSWTTIGSTSFAAGAALAGLAVTSHDNSTINQGVFEQLTAGLSWPWRHTDIGTGGQPGNASLSPSGTFTVEGSGSDIWGVADSFHYAYQLLPGDGQIIARVNGEQDTSPYAKAGVMMRNSLDEGAANVVLDVRPNGGIEFMARSAKGAATSFLSGGTQPFPAWLKLVRNGPTVTGFVSPDGSTWTPVGSTNVSMFDTITAGLAVTSHDTSRINLASFDHVDVTVSGGSTPPTPPPSPTNIVVYASDIPTSGVHGLWAKGSDSSSPNSVMLATPAGSPANTTSALAAPPDYVDVTFTAAANTRYTLWLRLRALNNSKSSDSIWVQFADAQINGAAAYPVGSTSGLLVNLATDSTGNSDQGWGWVNGAYWLTQPTTVTFAAGGAQTLRIQVREYGVALDQIVLSPNTFFNTSASCPNSCGAAPGPVSNDHTIVPKP
jgi:hypothetical protein